MLKPLAFAVAMLPLALQASNLPDYPFIHVGGTGYLRVMPDLGEIDFDICAVDADASVAVAQVQARVAEVQALLAEQGGDPGPQSEAEATFRDLRKEMRKLNATTTDLNSAPEVEIRSAVHIVVRDLSKWRAVMLGLLSKPNIDHLSTTFGKRDRLQVEQELTVVAIRDAQLRADSIAAGFGRKLGPVTAVSSGQLRNLTNAVGLAPSDAYNRQPGSRAAASEKDFLSIQSLEWSQTVDVIYRIK